MCLPIPRPEMALANTSILPIYWSQYLQLVDQSANDSRRDRLPPISHHRRKHRKRDKSKKFQYYIIYHNIITHPHNGSTYQSIGLHESGNISLSFHWRTRSTFIQQLFPRNNYSRLAVNHPAHKEQSSRSSCTLRATEAHAALNQSPTTPKTTRNYKLGCNLRVLYSHG